jgi:hypothetical protein
MSVGSRVALIVTFFATACAVQADVRASLLQEYSWTSSKARFGGFSGIEMDDDGSGFMALSDRGTLWRGQIKRDHLGRIIDIDATLVSALKTSRGVDVIGETGDSEGLAIAPDGTIYVSFEGIARVARFTAPDAAADRIARPDAFKRMQENSSLETLAIDEDGALYTLPERSGALHLPFPVWRYKNGAWTQPFSIPRDGNWLPVGADFGPDGNLYLLQRDFRGYLGFRSRITRYSISGDQISAGERILETGAGRYDNFEGISVWRDETGSIRLTLISDNNFTFYLRSGIAEFRLAD